MVLVHDLSFVERREAIVASLEERQLLTDDLKAALDAAATLAATGTVPVAGMALILGVDRFMSEARAITNFIGNSVATVAISRWEGEVTPGQLNANLSP